MVDHLTPEKRSECMSKIRGKNTTPELIVRKIVFSMGYRYRLHRKDLPGTPDLVFSSLNKVIFIHGCFWHSHPGCKRAFKPSTNSEFWQKKFRRTVERDRINQRDLRRQGWTPVIVWECEVSRDPNDVLQRLQATLLEAEGFTNCEKNTTSSVT